MIKSDLTRRASELIASREPFVYATVVRAQPPTSVQAGDTALVRRGGEIDGFVGGVCAEASVRRYAERTLATGKALLLRLEPSVGTEERVEDRDGMVVAHNPCLSGGSLEIFLDPQLPAARLVIAGDLPIARALEEIGRAAGYDVLRGDAREIAPSAGDEALIVASHGRDEEGVLLRALEAGIPYVALVASPRRGAAVLDSLDLPDDARAAIHTPAGLDIGARSPADIAISILAEIIATRGEARVPVEASAAAPVIAVDPICGMEVVASEASVHLDHGGERFYFCCDGCRAQFVRRAAEPASS
jgi:xanthine dehydrogenase accessory factor